MSWFHRKPEEEIDIDSFSMESQEARRYGIDTKERHSFSCWVRWVNSIYLALGLIIVFLQGIGVLELPEGVIIAMLGTTTANVLGLAYIILHGLFDKDGNKKNR